MKQYLILPLNLSRIAHIKRIDKGDTIPLKTIDKLLYCYLDTLGALYGYASIHPNIETISYDLAVSDRTINRSLSKLEKIGLIKRERVKQVGKFDSNKYTVIQPNRISRVKWLDITKSELIGDYYNNIYKKRTR